jgi:hypothetical protein
VVSRSLEIKVALRLTEKTLFLSVFFLGVWATPGPTRFVPTGRRAFGRSTGWLLIGHEMGIRLYCMHPHRVEGRAFRVLHDLPIVEHKQLFSELR